MCVVFFRRGAHNKGLQSVVAALHADHRKVRADHATGLLGYFVHGAFKRLVPGNGLRGIRSALQRKKVLPDFSFCFLLRADVQRHDKVGIAPRKLDGFAKNVN